MAPSKSQQLSNSESSENMLIEISNEGFCAKANEATALLSGFEIDEIIGKKFKDLVELDDLKLQEIENAISEASGIVVNFECYFHKKNGEKLFILWSAYWSVRNRSLICIGKNLSITEQRLVKANKELNLLNRVNDLLRTGIEGTDLLDLVCHTLIEEGKYQLAWFGLFKENQDKIEKLNLISKSGSTSILQDLFLDFNSSNHANDPFLEVSKIKIPLHEKYQDEYPEISRNSLVLKKAGMSNALFIPVNFGKSGLGILQICSNENRVFDFHEIQILERIADNISLQLRFSDSEQLNSNYLIKLSKIHSELELLNEVNDIILREKDEHHLLEESVSLILNRSRYKLVWVSWYHANELPNIVLVPQLIWGEQAYADSLVLDFNDPLVLKGPTAQAVLTGKTGIVNSTQSSKDYILWRERANKFGIKSSIALGLNLNSGRRGVICMYSGLENAFDEHEVSILERIVKNLSFAINSIEETKEKENIKNSLQESNLLLKDYKFALDSSAIVSVTDINGVITSVNDNLINLSGYSKDELLGKTHTLLNCNYHPQEFWKNLWDTILEGKVWYGEIKNKKKDGNCFWLDTTIIPIKNEDNSLKQFLAIRYDITDSKILSERNQFIQFLVESSEDSIIGLNTEAIITSYNSGAEKIYGFKAHEAIGQFIFDLLPTDNKNEQENFLTKLRTGQDINGKFQFSRKRKDGSLVPLSLTVSSIEDANGNRIGVSEVAKDTSQIIEAENKLQEQIKFLKEISFINSFEIKQEISKLNTLARFVNENIQGNPEINEVFNQSKRSFMKLESSLRKLSDLINNPIQDIEKSRKNTSTYSIQIICIVDDDVRHSLQMKEALSVSFNQENIYLFHKTDEAISFLKKENLQENGIVFLNPLTEGGKGWDYLKNHELLRFKSKVLLISEPISEYNIDRAKEYKSVGNIIFKPYLSSNNERVLNLDMMIWNK